MAGTNTLRTRNNHFHTCKSERRREKEVQKTYYGWSSNKITTHLLSKTVFPVSKNGQKCINTRNKLHQKLCG